jgi:predicted  nucleic acid-binding Zn-ribbon protein
MDYNQDCAFNRIHILDDTPANNENNGCAVFDGGINVNKNIHTKDLCSDYIETSKLKVFGSIGIQQDIRIEGSIYPIDGTCTSTLGSTSNKWDNLYLINGNIQTLNANTINIKNINIQNQFLIGSIINIPETYTHNVEYFINLDSSIIYINVPKIICYNKYSNIIITLPTSNVDYEYHKIVLTQCHNYNIKWNIPGNITFISYNNNQIYEILNIPNLKWKLTTYNSEKTHEKYYNKNDTDSCSETHSETCSDTRSETCSDTYSDTRSETCSDTYSETNSDTNSSKINCRKKNSKVSKKNVSNKFKNNNIVILKKLSHEEDTNIFNLIEVTIDNMMTGFNEQESKINTLGEKVDSLIRLKHFKDIDNMERIQNKMQKLEEEIPNMQNVNEHIEKLMEQTNNNHVTSERNSKDIKKLIEDVKDLNKHNSENTSSIARCIASTEKALKKMIDTIDTINESTRSKDIEIIKLKKIVEENEEKVTILNQTVNSSNNKMKKILKYLKLE